MLELLTKKYSIIQNCNSKAAWRKIFFFHQVVVPLDAMHVLLKSMINYLLIHTVGVGMFQQIFNYSSLQA